MSRSIAESVSLLNETLGNCKTNLKEKGVEADTIKISDVDEKIAEIKAGGGNGQQSYVYANSNKLLEFVDHNYSQLLEKRCFFTNEKAPSDVQTTDVSMRISNSVVCWIKDGDMYVSSQSDSVISISDLQYFLSSMNQDSHTHSYVYYVPFSEIYFDNVTTIFNNTFKEMLMDCSYLKVVDVSKFDFIGYGQTESKFSMNKMFYSCPELTTIYSDPWNVPYEGNDIFDYCPLLPNWNSSNKGIEMAKYKEDGGYFTNPAERVKS